MNFDQAFAILHDPAHEGGFSDNPKDPGNWTGGQSGQGICKGTKFGISAKSYPNLDIKSLTLDGAKAIYKSDFWDAARCDDLPDLLRFDVFDMAVNSSAPKRPVTVITLLQKAVGATPDGVFGPQTLSAVQAMDPNRLVRRFCAQRIRYYTGLPPALFTEFGRGWMNRIATNMELS